MTAATTDYAVDRLDDDGSPIRPNRDGGGPLGRLVWAPTVEGRRLDGAWWPCTRDAVAELNALIPPVSEHLHGPVTRVSLNIDAWGPDQPRRLRIGRWTRATRMVSHPRCSDGYSRPRDARTRHPRGHSAGHQPSHRPQPAALAVRRRPLAGHRGRGACRMLA